MSGFSSRHLFQASTLFTSIATCGGTKRDYLPILFDFAVPATRDITETISLLARMAQVRCGRHHGCQEHPTGTRRDCTRPAVRSCQPLLLEGSAEYGMFEHFKALSLGHR